MLASSSSSPRHRGSIERGVDGGDHRVIGGLAIEMYGDRLQEMIALSDRQRRRRALQQRELLVRERFVHKSTKCGGVVARKFGERARCPMQQFLYIAGYLCKKAS